VEDVPPQPAMQSVPTTAAAVVAPSADGVVPPKLPPVPVEQPGDLLASASFTVGDPRPPTATLSLDAPAWVKPADSVTVKLTAASYIGSGERWVRACLCLYDHIMPWFDGAQHVI
jgi:hypothetical protein